MAYVSEPARDKAHQALKKATVQLLFAFVPYNIYRSSTKRHLPLLEGSMDRNLLAVLITLAIVAPVASDDPEPVRKPRQHPTAPPLSPLLKQVRAFIRIAPLRLDPYR